MGNSSIINFISIRIRVWWFLHVARDRPHGVPSDVRDFVLKRALKRLKNVHGELSHEKQEELANNLIQNVIGGEPGDLSQELLGELLIAALERLDKIPLEQCFRCHRPVFQHKATKTDSGYLCESCTNQEDDSGY